MQADFTYSKKGIIGLCSLVYFVSYFARKDFAAALAAMIEGGAVDKAVGGYAMMGMFVAYGAGQLVSGYLGDRIKPLYLISFGLFVTFLCNMLIPLTPSAVLMIPIWTVNGFAQAMLWPPIVKLLSVYLDSESFVGANFIVTCAAHVATLLLYLFVPLCLFFGDYRYVFYAAGGITLISLVIFVIALNRIIPSEKKQVYINAPRAPKAEVLPEGTKVGYFGIILKSGVLGIFVAIVAVGFLRDGIETWLPTMFTEAFGTAAEVSVLVCAVMPIFAFIGILLATALYKYRLFNTETLGSGILFAVSALCAVPMKFILGAGNTVLKILSLILSSVILSSMHAANFLLISCLPHRFKPYGRTATTSGLTNACVYVGAAVSMYGLSELSEAYGWNIASLAILSVALLGALFCAVSNGKYRLFISGGVKR